MNDNSPDLALKRLRRLSREDAAANRDQRDPEFTSREIASLTGYSHAHIIRLLIEAGVGKVRCIKGTTRRAKVVKWSELKKLAKDHNWF